MRALVRIAAVSLFVAFGSVAAGAEEATPPVVETQPVTEPPLTELPPATPAPEVPFTEAPAIAPEEPPLTQQLETPAQKTPSVTELMVPGALGDRTIGDPAAPVKIIEYASMTCPHCQRFHLGTFPHLKEKYIDTGKVYFIFREFPLDDLALAVSMLARCAPAEGFYPALAVLFERQSYWSGASNPGSALLSVLQPLGFTADSFNACLDNSAVFDGIVNERKRAEETFGVAGTPSFFINGRKEVGALRPEDLDRLIDPML